MAEPTSRPRSQRGAVRAGATFVATALKMALSFSSGMLVARGLGAHDYGEYQFLLGSFAAVGQFLDLGTGFAFFTFLSRQRRSRRFLLIYAGWMAAQFSAVMLTVGLLMPRAVLERVWLGHDRGILLLAFAATFVMGELWDMVTQMGEARRQTVRLQAAGVTQGALHLFLVSLAVWFHVLAVKTVLIFLVVEYSALALVFGPRLFTDSIDPSADGSREAFGVVLREFTAYCRPLVVFSLVGVILAFADRWLLQRFGGAEQQGLFSVAQQFATVSLIATTSLLQVFWKEIAEASHLRDDARVATLYGSVSRALFFVSAWLSCAIVPYTREILALTVGRTYAGAALPLALMLMYPICQSMGRIGGSYFHASGDTRTHSRIGLWTTVIGFPMTYLLLAPGTASLPGLGLGATGLTIKTVVLGAIGVAVQQFVIARKRGWGSLFGYEIATVGSLLLLGFACRAVSVGAWSQGGGAGAAAADRTPTGAVISGALLYIVLSAFVAHRLRNVIGLSGRELLAAVRA